MNTKEHPCCMLSAYVQVSSNSVLPGIVFLFDGCHQGTAI